jgi:hypothetical protein
VDRDSLIAWLLRGDVAIQFQAQRDLLGKPNKSLQARIAKEGWGARFLARRHANGHWGRAFYQPKWTSTHYTLLDLKNLAIAPDNTLIRQSIAMVLAEQKGEDGGINPARTVAYSDVCVNGMILNYASYFGMAQASLKSIVDFLLHEWMADGGFNCYSNNRGAVHSSLHSTLSVIEGIREYHNNGYRYRLAELKKAELAAREFILQHRLFRSSTTGAIIDKKMLMLSYPSRWRFDILRALDYFQVAGVRYDERMADAFEVLMKKRLKDGRWPLQARHPGASHFEMEKPGKPSRWNTLRAMRVMQHFGLS